jgi:hypothetical protein
MLGNILFFFLTYALLSSVLNVKFELHRFGMS